ncbi:MAG: TapB family protein [Candidatus Xenobia bacterium]
MMRRSTLLLLVGAALTGCHRHAPPPPPDDGARAVPQVQHASTLQSTSYYPLTVGSAWFYRTEDDHIEAVSVDGETAGRITVGLVHGDKLQVTKQMRIENGRVLLCNTTTHLEDVKAKLSDAHRDYRPPMVLMEQHPKPGDKWQQNRFGTPAPCTVHGTETVTVPCGTFQAMRIDIVADSAPMTEWYAPGVGLVKWVDTHHHSMELISYDVK